MLASLSAIFFIVGSVLGGDENRPRLRFYHGVFENYTELPFNEATDIFKTSWYNSSRTTVIFCHGFTGHPDGPAVTAIIKAYLEQGQSNVALLNWERLAAPIYPSISSSFLHWALPNSIKLGDDFPDTVISLSEAGLDLNNTHLLGHSLGAHIMGLAGNKLARQGIVLPWITGLDPAGMIFDSKRPQDRLNPKSARFVDVIHSDPSKYGSKKSLGTVDFWPNFKAGAVQQPGCENRPAFNLEDDGGGKPVLSALCDHNRSWQLLLDAIKYPESVLGSYAKNFRVWKNYSYEQKRYNVLEMGTFSPNAKPGDYYLLTAAESPFGLGQDGL